MNQKISEQLKTEKKIILNIFITAILFGSCNQPQSTNTEAPKDSAPVVIDSGSKKTVNAKAAFLDKRITIQNCKIFPSVIADLKRNNCKNLVFQFSIIDITTDEVSIFLTAQGQKQDNTFTAPYKLGDDVRTFSVPNFLLLGNQLLSMSNISNLLKNGTDADRPDLQFITLNPTYNEERVQWAFDCQAFFINPNDVSRPEEGRITNIRTDPSPPAPSFKTVQELKDSLTGKK